MKQAIDIARLRRRLPDRIVRDGWWLDPDTAPAKRVPSCTSPSIQTVLSKESRS